MKNNTILNWRTFPAIIIFLLGISLCACSGKNEEYKGYYIYCVDANETRIEGEKYTPKAKETDKLIQEFLNRLTKDPQNISLKKAIPENVQLDEYNLNSDSDLCLYWPASYGNYTGIAEILRRAAIVKTLCQVSGVNTVEFYVAGQPLTDSNMNAVGFMTAETFIDNTGKEAYTQTSNLTIYFGNDKGTRLKKVSVKVTSDATIPLEQLALKQLIAGPAAVKNISEPNLRKTIPEGTKINKISIKENTCYLDLSEAFLEKPDDISDDVAIYSVVNTLAELPNINKVQFSINGEQVLFYDEHVGFGEPFEANLDIIE